MRYWDIGTSASAVIKKFRNLIVEKDLNRGDNLFDEKINETNFLIDKKGKMIYRFSSKATHNQYLKVWEAIGFIKKDKNKIKIVAAYKNYESLCLYSLIFILENSNNERINSYRKSIIINTLYYANNVSIIDLKRKGIRKSNKELDAKSICKNISDYERNLAKNKKILEIMRRKYDKEF